MNDKFKRLDQAKSERMAYATSLYRKFDKDRNGTLSLPEWKALCKEIYKNQYSESQVVSGFKAIDKNGDGNVGFNEFIDCMLKIIVDC